MSGIAEGILMTANVAIPNQIKPKVFRDPVHDLIVVPEEDAFILALLNTREMQRLRRIRQLGVSYLVYPGAEHSRFTHSLGVYHCVCRILEALRLHHRGDQAILDTLTRIERSLKAAALLHDVGHGPFSHAFERFSGVSHELVTQFAITDAQSEVRQVLEQHGIDPEDVSDIINKTSPEPLAVDILSSELDADRMDYLLRDSYMCGVTYGRFDLDWMLHVLRVVELPSIHRDKLAVDASHGVRAIEEYVIARIHMYQQVYLHKTTRGFEGVVLNTLNAARERLATGWDGAGADGALLTLLKKGTVTPADVLSVDDFTLLRALDIWAALPDDHTEAAPVPRLARAIAHRKKMLRAVNVQVDPQSQMSLGELKADLEHHPELRFLWYVDGTGGTYYKGILYNLRKGEQEPEEKANTTIYALRNGIPCEVERDSDMLRGLSGQEFHARRFFYDRDHEQEFHRLLQKHRLLS
jgi:uncharacterized protein